MSFGNGLDNEEELMSEINMTPLVDVMLVLLIIFIVAMPLINQSIEIDLPQASNKPVKKTADTITLSVNKAGDVFWNDQITDYSNLNKRLQEISATSSQTTVHLKGHKQVNYEHVMKLMTAVQLAGITKIGFITKPEQASN